MSTLPRSFYLGHDVVRIARDLLGKVVVTRMQDEVTAAAITETEAYAGELDRASHAHGGRRTARTEVMYARGGTAYVYLCYGIHHLFNVVTNEHGTPHAVLIRAAMPLEGMVVMNTRLGREAGHWLKGPGVVSKALGIRTAHTGADLLKGPITIEDRGLRVARGAIIAGPRIGVDFAGPDALLPYRFHIRPSDLR
jgi:DNA-3-methyladenine glycosylase